MKTSPRRRLLLPLFAAILPVTLIVGCGSDGFVDQRDQLEVVPVTGEILVDGSAYPSPDQPDPTPRKFRVVMVPDEATQATFPAGTPTPSCWVEPDGTTFHMGTYTSSDGAPAGNYKVTFEAGKINLMNGGFIPGELGGKYSDPETSELKLEVTITGDEDSVDLGTIELSTP